MINALGSAEARSNGHLVPRPKPWPPAFTRPPATTCRTLHDHTETPTDGGEPEPHFPLQVCSRGAGFGSPPKMLTRSSRNAERRSWAAQNAGPGQGTRRPRTLRVGLKPAQRAGVQQLFGALRAGSRPGHQPCAARRAARRKTKQFPQILPVGLEPATYGS